MTADAIAPAADATADATPTLASCAFQDLSWARHAGGSSWEMINAMDVTPAGSSVIAGGFSGSAVFGGGEPNQTVLSAIGDFDVVLARYAPSGQLEWAVRAGGDTDHFSDIDIAIGVAVAPDESIYVVGEFEGLADIFGPGDPNETILTSNGFKDLFVARYTPDGELVWARSAGGMADDQALDVAIHPDGGIVVSGRFKDRATFFGGAAPSIELLAEGEFDLFVARYDGDGDLAWASSAGGPFDDLAEVTVGSDGSIYISGPFTGPAIFARGTPQEITIDSTNQIWNDMFIARYHSNGKLAWVRVVGGDDFAVPRDLSSLSDGMVVTGYFYGTITFGLGEPGETSLVAEGIDDAFIARYSTDGDLEWAVRAGGGKNDFGEAIATTSADDIFVTGYVESGSGGTTVTFGGGDSCETSFSPGGTDTFVAHYAPSGELLSLAQATSTFPDRVESRAVAVAQDGSLVIAGAYQGTATFGDVTLPPSAGGRDLFVAKYGPAKTPEP